MGMFEITAATLLIYLIVGHVTLVKRVKHLEKIVRWVEIQSNKNAININAISSIQESEHYAENNAELPTVKFPQCKPQYEATQEMQTLLSEIEPNI